MQEALDASEKLIEANPEFMTTWNYSKLPFDDKLQALINEEFKIVSSGCYNLQLDESYSSMLGNQVAGRCIVLLHHLGLVLFSHMVVVLSISVVVMLPASTMAAKYVVGGDSGWTTDYNYTAWAQGKVFYVGDKLVFNYPKDVHDVYKVDAASFASCTVTNFSNL
ncbi:putative cupredoxin, partial [Tanacetum coccineum]